MLVFRTSLSPMKPMCPKRVTETVDGQNLAPPQFESVAKLSLSSSPLPLVSMLGSKRGDARFWPLAPPSRETTAHAPMLKWEREGTCLFHRKWCKILAINSTEYLGMSPESEVMCTQRARSEHAASTQARSETCVRSCARVILGTGLCDGNLSYCL